MKDSRNRYAARLLTLQRSQLRTDSQDLTEQADIRRRVRKRDWDTAGALKLPWKRPRAKCLVIRIWEAKVSSETPKASQKAGTDADLFYLTCILTVVFHVFPPAQLHWPWMEEDQRHRNLTVMICYHDFAVFFPTSSFFWFPNACFVWAIFPATGHTRYFICRWLVRWSMESPFPQHFQDCFPPYHLILQWGNSIACITSLLDKFLSRSLPRNWTQGNPLV